jgi:hypothetical protein
MTLIISALLIMTVLILLNMGSITYSRFYFKMTSVKTLHKKHLSNIEFMNAISKVITNKVFINIVVTR